MSVRANRLSATLSEKGYGVSFSAAPGDSPAVWQEVLAGSTFAYLFKSVWISNELSSWRLVLTTITEQKGHDRIGGYDETCLHWKGSNATGPEAVSSPFPEFVSCAKNYTESNNIVAFSYSFPQGNPSPSSSSLRFGNEPTLPETLTNFPAMSRVDSRFAGRLSWQGVFAASTNAQTYGFSGGPTVFFPTPADTANAPPSVAIVASPLDNFKVILPTLACLALAKALQSSVLRGTRVAEYSQQSIPKPLPEIQVSTNAHATLANASAPWVPGLIPTITSLPRGFKHTFIVAIGDGVTHAMTVWGEALQRYYNVSKMLDPTLSSLSYQTDNGAE